MNFNNIVSSIKSFNGNISYNAKKYSPELCTAGAIISGIACVILVHRASKKDAAIIEEHKRAVEKVHISKKNEDPSKPVVEGKELTKVYCKTAGKFIKLYAMPFAFGSLSIVLTLTSLGIMKKRFAAASLLAATANAELDEVRKNIIEKYGEDEYNELSGKVKKEKKTRKEVDPETGEEKEVEYEEEDWKYYSVFTRVFEHGVRGYKDPKKYGPWANIAWIKSMQDALQGIIDSRGYATLNDAYDLFDWVRINEGDDIGWLRGDIVDFGLRNPKSRNAVEFLNGETDKFYIQFNVRREPIYDKIKVRNDDVLNYYKRMGAMEK